MGGATEKLERLHSTVRLNQFTLQFEDTVLEKAYQAGLHPRKKALWLRSLLPAAASQLLFALADGLDYPIENLLVTVPTRVFLAMLQVAIWLLVRWDLVQVKEQTMLMVSVASGIPTLLLYTLQRPSLRQWDALFVTFGLSFYTIPKVTPLGYVSSFYGSWATAAVYMVLTFLVRPPFRRAESVLGIFFLIPIVWVFNTIAYYSEYNSRERFALRQRLRRESITLAVACTSAAGDTLLQGGEEDGWLLLRNLSLRGLMAANNTNTTASFISAVILWGAFTLGSWTSLPETLKFVDEATGWAWFSHCAGVTVFLLVMTRRLRWLLVVPVVGAFVLWVLSLAMPASWIIFSAHSVGYGLLLASVVIAMGVFGWFMCAWKELVSFLTRSCFLYPQLQAGMEREYPLLVKIVSEYTAGLDPELLSARVPTATAIDSMRLHSSLEATEKETIETRDPTDMEPKENVKRTHFQQNKDTFYASKGHRSRSLSLISNARAPLSSDPANPVHPARKMVSVLPSFKPGKCFFCSKNEAEHFVPACGMWGKWTHWRMNQQHHLNHPVGNTKDATNSNDALVVAMCTSYYDLQNDKCQLQSRVQAEETKNAHLMTRLQESEGREQTLSLENVRLKAKLHAMEEKHAANVRRRERHLEERLESVQKEANRLAHEQKAQMSELERQVAASELLVHEATTREHTAKEETALLRSKLIQSEQDINDWKSKAEALRNELSSLQVRLQDETLGTCFPPVGRVNVAKRTSLQTLHPSGRLPYAQLLEIEGLRESSRHSPDDVDYSRRWRLLQLSKCNSSEN